MSGTMHIFGLDPTKHIVAHRTLDPERGTDPLDAFCLYGVT
ncbi:hypothetical protein [Thermaerobacillus caldiproteolyticus]|uniref:N-acetyl-anhydromuramyl-L-alanine amidase AmpD n=1 Tax=Thermaerobacillus caldiproteolyticus TaxID=247480 RepID=A0A7V9Z9F4_9BACL|nr:hypothetical protein [Anoxybacillus caldiproteolyticus]MBA2876472.1 N-acetyl-anhydromuramyl-L-alanine amidase AmpD [Anoxybacillus caldiproteolyticus]